MRIDTVKLKKLLLKVLPYLLFGLFCTHFGQKHGAWRRARMLLNSCCRSLQTAGARVPQSPSEPSPCRSADRTCFAVQVYGPPSMSAERTPKHFRHNIEYGSARWGNAKDIEPFIDPVFANNVILTKTERLMMSNRPKNPANARNKNVLIVGGSGSGKTRFWIKPKSFTASQFLCAH